MSSDLEHFQAQIDKIGEAQTRQLVLLTRLDERQTALMDAMSDQKRSLETHISTGPSFEAMTAIDARVKSLEGHATWLWRSTLAGAFTAFLALVTSVAKKIGLG